MVLASLSRKKALADAGAFLVTLRFIHRIYNMPIDAESIITIIKDGMPALEVLAGSKAVALFIEKVSGALGWYLEPRQIERKARAEVVASIIKAEADQEIKSVGERTVARIIYEETRHQQNMESVVLNALPSIKEDAKPDNLDDDWLTNFFDKCRKVSNEEMQKLWSQLLAGEVNNPGSFSVRTLNNLATLTKNDALLFRRICSYVWLDAGVLPRAVAKIPVLRNKMRFHFSGTELYQLLVYQLN